ncbi:hypothetical protein JG688_00009687 [Phytophthora aleatoria]|uniref:Uncharacterized protein n=1 Tax=Phytophthora aleatoria TaxID=2496075 RepID=A0A8J5IG26_9STRA|nr:hypothetical protein JG688_00009687 [Phytophthora aleatoria]
MLRFALPLSLLCCMTTRVSASAALKTLFGQSDFHYHVDLDNVFSPLEYLATFDLGNDGTFELVFDVKFPMATLEDGDDRSFPLENQSRDNLVYQSKKTVAGSGNASFQSDFSRLTGSTTTKLTFYIDACELLGGEETILRSCLEYPPPTANDHNATCYYCPENFPERSKADEERWSKESKYTAGQFASPNFNMVAISALLAQVVALAETAEVALFIAAGWGITQESLERIDIFRIRSVSVEWALVFVILKQLGVDNIGIAVIWSISWFSIMFLIHHYSAANLKMLRLRYRIGEQLSIDTSMVMWKGTLFLNFRRLQKGFLFVSTITALTGSDNRWRFWEWISVQGHETLIFLLYSVLGYICRCQQFRFSELENLEIEVTAEGNETTTTQENGSADSVSVIPVIVEPPRKKTTALILNPDKSVLLGTAYALEKPVETEIPVPKE